jgi:hypothetical protein
MEPESDSERMGQIVDRARVELERREKNMTQLLKHVGLPSRCYSCGQPIVWVRHIDSKRSRAYNPDGELHGATCQGSPLVRGTEGTQGAQT